MKIGHGLEKTRKEIEVFWFELDIVNECEIDKVVVLMGDLNAQVTDVNISGVLSEY